MLKLVEIVWRQPGFWGGAYDEIPLANYIVRTIGYPMEMKDGYLYVVQSVDEEHHKFTNIQAIPVGSIIEKRSIQSIESNRLGRMDFLDKTY